MESRAGIQTIIETNGTYELTPDQETELYTIAREILNNVLKHAHANQVLVRLEGESGRFSMSIQDDGVGFDLETAKQAGGQGLRNIQERAKNIGATCTIQSAPGMGTKTIIELAQ